MQNGNYGQNQSLHQSVSWHPAVHRGSRYRTFKLGQVNSDCWEYKATWVSYSFALVPIVVGLGFMYATSTTSRLGGGLNPAVAILCLCFVVVGLVLLRKSLRKYIFDFRQGIYWENPIGFGRKHGPQFAKGEVLDLNRVIALQVLSESWETSSRDGNGYDTHTSYELNMVLNQSRRNIVDHGDLKAVVKEGKAIAQKMGVPLLLQDPSWQRF